MTEIYQEGLRIPLVRLFRSGELVQDVLDLLLLNARVPEERRGDYFAQIAACRLGARRVAELIEARGLTLVFAAFEQSSPARRSVCGRRSPASSPASTASRT